MLKKHINLIIWITKSYKQKINHDFKLTNILNSDIMKEIVNGFRVLI